MAETNVTISREVRETTKQTTDGAPAKTAATPPREVMKKVTLGKKKRKLSPAVLVAGLVILGAAFWYFFLRTPAAAPLVVRYSAVDVGDISRSVTATGTLQPTTTVQVGSQVSGMITELYADFNTKVQKGQLLAKLDSTTFQAAVTQARANVTKSQADLDAAIKDEARQRQLLTGQLIAQADYDVSKNKLDDARATVQQTTASLKQAEANRSYTVIRSPISGVVTARDVDRGQTVAAGFNAPVLFVIAEDLTKMQVSAAVDEADIGQVVSGQSVKFNVDAYPGEQFEGIVQQVRINSVVTQNVVTYAVIITTANPDQRLLPGMTATVNIVNASRTGVLRVPVSATRFVPPPEMLATTGAAGKDTTTRVHRQRTPGGSNAGAGQPSIATVYVKSNAKTGPQVEPVKVVTGLSDGSYTEILNSTPPLHPGDSVVVAAFSMSAGSAPSGTSPLSTPRPPGGGGGGAARRF